MVMLVLEGGERSLEGGVMKNKGGERNYEGGKAD